MKLTLPLLVCCVGISLATSARAGVYLNFPSIVSNQSIPDGNPSGLQSTINVASLGWGNAVGDVNVNLNITGGYNGDLYAYLVHGSGFVVLLNRVGKTAADSFGYASPGFNGVTLDDSAAVNIHTYYPPIGGFGGSLSSPLTGTWQPDGRNTDPATVTDGFSPNTSLANFNTLDYSGNWTLFFADMATGDTSTLTSWSLDIEVVPEPITAALLVFAGLGAAAQGVKIWRRRSLPRRS